MMRGAPIALCLMVTSCALDSTEKTRCERPEHCVPPLSCIDGRCVNSSADAGTIDGSERPPTAGACPDGGLCPAEQNCENGLCRYLCSENDMCPEAEECNTNAAVCVDHRVSVCPDRRCANTQACFFGVCSTEVPSLHTPCDEAPTGDGCPTDAICFSDVTLSVCRQFPRCPNDEVCPVGPNGGVCSRALYPAKVAMCVPGYCTSSTHCPSGQRCLPGLSVCSDGQTGSACNDGNDCTSGRCHDIFHICQS